jgi:hypothetical protein
MACADYRQRFGTVRRCEELLFKDFKSKGFWVHQTKISNPMMLPNL